MGAGAWSNGPGDRYAAHRHEYDKVLVASAGSIEFELPEEGRHVALEAGDRLELPAGTLHAAVVGGNGVTCLEAHLARGALRHGIRCVPGWAGDAETGSPGAA
jgi:quercetin dioxygenase-like cupin family protein